MYLQARGDLEVEEAWYVGRNCVGLLSLVSEVSSEETKQVLWKG